MIDRDTGKFDLFIRNSKNRITPPFNLNCVKLTIMNIFLLASTLFLIIFSNTTYGSALFSSSQKSDSDEHSGKSPINGHKRKHSDSLTNSKLQVEGEAIEATADNKSVIRSVYYHETISKVFRGFNTKVVPDYADPSEDFFDKFIRRSFYIKLSNTIDSQDIWLWDLPCTSVHDITWHTEAFFFLMVYNVFVAEHVIVEYFQYILRRWIKEREDLIGFKSEFVIGICKYAIFYQYDDLLEEVLKFMKSENSGIALMILLARQSSRFPLCKNTFKWQTMCLKVIKAFPRIVYADNLRLNRFFGAKDPSLLVYIHLTPILRTLLIRSRDEFDTDQELFDTFALFQTGNLESKLPIGIGGLQVVNQMFLRSRINLSAFSTPIETSHSLKTDIIVRLFDAIFLGIKPADLAKILFDQKAFSVFESFLKYSSTFPTSEADLIRILGYFITKSGLNCERDFISAMISYLDIPEKVWDRLLEIFASTSPAQVEIVSLYRIIKESLKEAPIGQLINLSTGKNVHFKVVQPGLIDSLSERLRKPIQLEVARIFLARSCGIPLEMTKVDDTASESFEWSETVGFINFHVERVAIYSAI